MTETLEKEEKQLTKEEEKEKQKEFDKLMNKKLFEQITEFCTSTGKEMIYDITKKINKRNNDALSQTFNKYIDENAKTQEEQNQITDAIAFGITAYLTYRNIRKEIEKAVFTKCALDRYNIDNSLGIIAQKGDRKSFAIIPKSVIEGKTDEEIFEFAKTLLLFKEHLDDIKDAEFKILSADELKSEFEFAKNCVGKKKVDNIEIEEIEE